MAIGKHMGVLVAASLLSGCSAFDSVWSTLAGSPSNNTLSAGRVIAVPTPGQSATATAAGMPAVGARAAAPVPSVVPVTAASSGAAPIPSIVPVGAAAKAPAPAVVPAAAPAAPQAQGVRAELQRLQDDLRRQNAEALRLRQALAQDGASYYGTIGTIHARLQMGAAPDDPEVVAQWNLAQVALDRMSADIARLAVLSGESASDSTLAAQVLDGVKSGAAAGDAQAIENDTKSAQALISQLVNAIAEDIARQTSYLDHERANLVSLRGAIKTGELYGRRLADGRYAPTLAALEPAPRASLSGSSSDRRPLVVIRFREPNVAYEDALYRAVRTALERRPDASFDLVAVAPPATSAAAVGANSRAAKRYAESVLRSLTGMGLPAERVSLSATTSAGVTNDEVQVYVR